MSVARLFMLCSICGLMLLRSSAQAQTNPILELLSDLQRVEKDEAEAKRARLQMIDSERNRIAEEMRAYQEDLADLRKMVPDPVRPRVLTPAVAKARSRTQTAFNSWVQNNDPALTTAIMKGDGLNALLRVLGPVAHYRKLKSTEGASATHFPSLVEQISSTDASHFRMIPATTSGSRVVVRLNQLPLDIQWPPVVMRHWPSDCKSIQKVRDVYVSHLAYADTEEVKHLEQAELMDSSLALLQAKIMQKRKGVPRDVSLAADIRNQLHRDLLDALRYLENLRATATRLKNAPSDYKVHRFSSGNVEDFLDFCYTHGMYFEGARPADESHYMRMFRRLQDYAKDLQYIEDWKDDLEQRIRELGQADKSLVWAASVP